MSPFCFSWGIGLLRRNRLPFASTTGLDPFNYWTLGWPMVLSLLGLACLVLALLWTAVVLVVYAFPS
jgi:hypothetical protein